MDFARSRATQRGETLVATFKVMTYNVHSCIGTDGKLAPERIAEVIARSGADIVALQELDALRDRAGGMHQPEWLAGQLKMFVHFTPARACGDGHYGNAILSRYPFSVMSEGMLKRLRGEQRAAQWLRLSIAGLELNVINTHLSTHFRERLQQIEQLMGAEWLAKADSGLPLIICGDLNASQFSPVYRRLRAHLVDVQRANGSRAAATYPSRLPLVRIDHVFTSKSIGISRCEVPRDALSVVASDHLPLLAELSYPRTDD